MGMLVSLTLCILTGGLLRVAESNLGGWENFLSGEIHGPQAKGEVSIGNDGAYIGGGYETWGASAKIGGAEYDGFFGGTEIGFSGGGVAGGFNAGFTATDDDGDGRQEYGFQLGGGLGLKGGLEIKTEAFSHLADIGSSAWEGASDMASSAGSAISSGWDSLWGD